jgi:Arc/MetJ-type ribon-helix-helix transcriptional regulator
LKNKSVIINNLTVDDINTYKILKDIKEDKREDFIKKAIVIGTIGLRNLYLTENVDYIEKEFKGLMNQFESRSEGIRDMIEETFDIESNSSSLGKLRVLFEDYFDRRKGKMSDLLSPFEEESPIKKLKDEIFKKIQDLRDELLKERVKEEITAKTTLKGRKFEDIVLENVEIFCAPYEDKVTFVGDKLGKTNKIGDINIDIDSNDKKRITIECKDTCAYSHKKTVDEIGDAIKNRDAKFGIFLFKEQSQIPSALQPIKITNNYIVTSFDDYGLYFAFRVAKIFVERSTESKQKTIPVEKIQKEIEELKRKLLAFSNIQTKLTQIDNASSYIRENIERLKKDIEEGLSNIKELIG